jgi:DNA polymerase-3 subunit alpha
MEQTEIPNRSMNFSKDFQKYDLGLHGLRMPVFEIDQRHKTRLKLPDSTSNYDFLRSLAREGFYKLNLEKGSNLYKRYIDRVNYELQILQELEFIDYIILIWDVINYCRENNIPTGPGRGSCAGSLLLFLIDVTKIDPIKYELFFERFISKARAKKTVIDGVTYFDGSLFPDVDLDICYYNRYKVIAYLEEKFKGKTSKILTLNTLSSKLCIKESGKVVAEKQESEMNDVSSYIPKLFGQVKSLEEAVTESEKFAEWASQNDEVYKIALKLQNLNKNKGVHPSGLLLAHSPLEESCPVELSSDKQAVSSYDMNNVTAYNIKLDLLGLRGVSVVDDVCKSLGIRYEDIDVNDVFIYQQLQDFKLPHGLFQIEAETNFKVCQKVKPKNLEQLSGVLALARPGALQFIDKYANYTNNDHYESIHPFFDDILGVTGGVCLYQEQLMKMVSKVGFSLDEAEIVRRCVGKKKVEEMKEWEQKIKDKISQQKLDPKIGEVLWRIANDSANYQFNKSHSVAYAALAAISIYLKFKYPQQFFLSLLKMSKHEPDPIGEISKIEKELVYFNIKLLPPHLLKSKEEFCIEGDNIRFGLLSVKGISEKTIMAVNEFRGEFKNKFDIFETASQANLNIGVLCALIQAGALDGDFKQSRSKIVYEAQLWNVLTNKEKVNAKLFGESFDYDLVKILMHMKDNKDVQGKPYIKESRLQTMRTKAEPYKKIYEINSKSESFANWFYENSIIGYSVRNKLREVFISKKDDLVYIKDIADFAEKDEVCFIGVIQECKSGVSREKKTRYFKMQISDETGAVNTMIFSDKIDDMQNLNNRMPKEEDIVIVTGQKFGDSVFARMVAIQTHTVYTKLSQLKAEKNN